MKKRSRRWQLAALAYGVINVGGAIIAIVQGEPMHAGAHGALLLIGPLLWQFLPGWEASEADVAAAPVGEFRLDSIQQSVDAIALEVERIGEAQRYQTKVVQERMNQPKE